jgi:hypothetical protein
MAPLSKFAPRGRMTNILADLAQAPVLGSGLLAAGGEVIGNGLIDAPPFTTANLADGGLAVHFCATGTPSIGVVLTHCNDCGIGRQAPQARVANSRKGQSVKLIGDRLVRKGLRSKPCREHVVGRARETKSRDLADSARTH